jgi:hypothetical protein
LLRFSLNPGRAIIAPYGGAYLNIPLYLDIEIGDFSVSQKYTFAPITDSIPLSLGVVGGLSVGTRFGPGNIFVDARYAYDLGNIAITASDTRYHRSMISISLGYEFGLFKKKR